MDDLSQTPGSGAPVKRPEMLAWEHQTLEKLVFAALQEQKARRRWGIFFKLAVFVYLILVVVVLADFGGAGVPSEGNHTALVQLNGTIEVKGEANAEKINSALRNAFAEKSALGVILRINSPGGSPVQSAIINDEIRRLRAQYPNKPLYVVVEDICASGGYYVAAAADKIYVNKASIVGSIGVLMDGFGFTGTMEKLGVERRMMTAGGDKGFLDPFSPENEKHKEHAQMLLKEIHQQFIDVVKAGRGKRLKEHPDMFSGLIWTGSQSIKLGLADDFGTVESVARDVIKAEKLLDYTVKENIAERFAKRLGASTMSGFWSGFAETFGIQVR
ncbi:MAG TPA: S49 family peptidase [Lentisphaeria bacterium]|nr:S49 family peptidase [Lentisphaeria bacterium]